MEAWEQILAMRHLSHRKRKFYRTRIAFWRTAIGIATIFLLPADSAPFVMIEFSRPVG
jgi:hypothetical protein